MMAQLAPEGAVILDILTQGKEMREGVPIADRTLMRRPEKYAAPIGLDDEGNPFPVPPRRDIEEKP